MYTFLLYLTSLFSLSCSQTSYLVPPSTPLEEAEQLHMEWSIGTKNVTDCSKCCTNFSCMYNLIVNGLRESEEFEALGNLLYLSGDEKPVFIPINVNLEWSQCFHNTSEIKPQSNSSSYIWGANATYAAFGPAQEFFQSDILFDAIIKAVSLLEQWRIPKLATINDQLEDWVMEHDQTLTVNISDLMCVSDIHTLNQSLADTLSFVTAEALTKVSVYAVTYNR